MAPTPATPTPAIDCHAQAQIDAKKPHPNSKKIFVFCDGTGNKFSDAGQNSDNSNVVKLYITLRISNDQIAYYHPGVGTMGDPTIRHAFPRFWSRVKGLAFGAGFKDNVLDTYRYLMEVYNDCDEIYIFGFSRGAYTARALAGMLHGYGLLCRGNEGHIPYVWNLFVDAVKQNRQLLKKKRSDRTPTEGHSIARDHVFLQTYSRGVMVRFMGIWDTVSSVGWISKPVRLLDMAQNPIIQVGRHAVSIDERRAFYRDNLWGAPVPIHDKEWPEKLRQAGFSQDLAQVWFPGVHSDVGGSYRQKEAAPANESLHWMIEELKLHGAQLCEERVAMVLGRPSGHYDADRIFHPPPKPGHCLHESLKGLWWILQCFPQQYYDKDDEKIEVRVPYAVPRKIPDAAFIHSSALDRINNVPATAEPAYNPRNLHKDWCKKIGSPDPRTTANLDGCYVYQRPSGLPREGPRPFARKLKVIVGAITYAVFWVILLSIALYLLKGAVWIVAFAFKALQVIPGLIRFCEFLHHTSGHQ